MKGYGRKRTAPSPPPPEDDDRKMDNGKEEDDAPLDIGTVGKHVIHVLGEGDTTTVCFIPLDPPKYDPMDADTLRVMVCSSMDILAPSTMALLSHPDRNLLAGNNCMIHGGSSVHLVSRKGREKQEPTIVFYGEMHLEIPAEQDAATYASDLLGLPLGTHHIVERADGQRWLVPDDGVLPPSMPGQRDTRPASITEPNAWGEVALSPSRLGQFIKVPPPLSIEETRAWGEANKNVTTLDLIRQGAGLIGDIGLPPLPQLPTMNRVMEPYSTSNMQKVSSMLKKRRSQEGGDQDAEFQCAWENSLNVEDDVIIIPDDDDGHNRYYDIDDKPGDDEEEDDPAQHYYEYDDRQRDEDEERFQQGKNQWQKKSSTTTTSSVSWDAILHMPDGTRQLYACSPYGNQADDVLAQICVLKGWSVPDYRILEHGLPIMADRVCGTQSYDIRSAWTAKDGNKGK